MAEMECSERPNSFLIGSDSKHIIHMPDLDYTPDPRGLGYVFYQCMLKNKDKVAQIYGPTGEKDTYGNLLQRCIRAAIAMKIFGIIPGDFVSICSFNHLDSCTPVIASHFAGAIMAAVDPTLSVEDTIHLLKQVPPKLIFVVPEAVELIEKVLQALKFDTKIIVFGKTTKHTPFSELLEPSEEESNFKPAEAKSLKDTALIFFTSGTSGFPKGICLNHLCMLCQFQNFANCGCVLDITFSIASPYWTIFAFLLGTSITRGATRLVFPKFVPEEIWKIFEYKPTFLFLNPMQVITMLGQGRPKHLNIDSVKDIVVGGGPLKLSPMIAAREMLPEARIQSGYGQSEVPGPLMTFKPNNPKDLDFIVKKPPSCGGGMEGFSYKIVDVETEEILGPNLEGELRVKTEFQLNGYHLLDSSEIWDSDGWLRTGDVAYYDDDGCFFVVDRIKEMFKFQCWHIAPAVLESVILTHPAVCLAVVIGIPHDFDGDHPMGVVLLKPNCNNTTAQEIEKYVEQRVSDRQRLRAGVEILDNFPITASGKIDRRKIKTMVLEKIVK